MQYHSYTSPLRGSATNCLTFDVKGPSQSPKTVQVCNMEVLTEVQSMADQLVASGKAIRYAVTDPGARFSHARLHTSEALRYRALLCQF